MSDVHSNEVRGSGRASWSAVILAAGHGTRMKSARPKVLHEAAGRPLLYYPLRAALDAGAQQLVVVIQPSMQADVESALVEHLPGAPIEVAFQEQPRGTGDAARAGLQVVREGRVAILNGDAPLLAAADIELLLASLDRGTELCFLSCELEDPSGYGRVLRSEAGQVRAIREHRDLTDDVQRAVREINVGVYGARSDVLRALLGEITPNNAQGEYYLTDVVALLAERTAHDEQGSGGTLIEALTCGADALVGVNDRDQLHEAEQRLHARIARHWARQGVTVRGRPLIDDPVVLEEDVMIEDGVRLRGATRVRRGAVVDVGSVLTDATVGAGAIIKPYSVITESSVGERAHIGPFAHLRPESTIEDEAHVGNFVETKKTRLRRGAKANHLAYLGDGDVGEQANIGAGTIFCNYDGFRKHRTEIGARAFVGSDSQLVAPVRIGEGAYVATGTTVTSDVPDDGFAIGRCRQTTKSGYASQLKKRLEPSSK